MGVVNVPYRLEEAVVELEKAGNKVTADDLIRRAATGEFYISSRCNFWTYNDGKTVGEFNGIARIPQDIVSEFIEWPQAAIPRFIDDDDHEVFPATEFVPAQVSVSQSWVTGGQKRTGREAIPSRKTTIVVRREKLLVMAPELERLKAVIAKKDNTCLPSSKALAEDEGEVSRKTLSKIVYLLAQELAERRPDVFRRGQTLNKSAFAKIITEQASNLNISIYGLTSKTFGKVIAEVEEEKNKKKLSNSLD